MREAPQPRGQHGDQSIDSFGDEIDIQMAGSSYGQTSKERFNYASFDCAAAVLKANPEAKGSSSILDENQDRYMLNKCSASNKFVIVEMCEDILVDTVVLANLEFFSSTFKDFRISVSDRYPIQEKEWKTLGTFLANNTRTLQVFAIKNPLIWARYLRIDFLTHFGNEFYCPLTLLRVHGTTMMEEYKNQENINQEKPHQTLAGAQPTKSKTVAASSIPSETQSETSLQLPKGSDIPIGNATASTSRTISQSVLGLTDANPSSAATLVPLESFTSSPNVDAEEQYSPEASTIVGYGQKKDSSISSSALEAVSPSRETTSSEEQNLPSTSSDSEAPFATSLFPEKETAAIASSAFPATQESVYKTITKRLSLLEANATLSLQYIEEQSQLLRDVFNKMERRHSQKIETLLSELNSTLATKLSFFVQSQFRSSF